MKAILVSLLLLCCLFGINNGQLTASQITGNWLDDNTNAGIGASCCVPIASSTVPLVVAGTSTITTTGKWGTASPCTNLGLSGASINSQTQTLTSSANANSFPIAFTYTYTSALTLAWVADAASSPSVVQGSFTLGYAVGSQTCSQTVVTSNTGFAKATFSTWGGTSTPIQYFGTESTASSNCCYPKLSTSASVDALTNIQGTYANSALTLTWTWDTTSSACKTAGLSGTATATFTGSTYSSSAGSNSATSLTTYAPSTNVLNSASTASWTYVTQGTSCTFNTKKSSSSSSSSASHVVLSFVGFVLLFVAHL